jgi:hypothetical protein
MAPPLTFRRSKSCKPLSIADRRVGIEFSHSPPRQRQRALEDGEMAYAKLGKCGRVLSTLAAIAWLSAPGARAFARDHDMNVLAQASSGPWRCEIRKYEADGSVELTGYIMGPKAVAGHSRFTVTKSSPSGTSNINQANKFDLAADEESQVALVRINLEGAGQLSVELFVRTDDGVECRAKTTL